MVGFAGEPQAGVAGVATCGGFPSAPRERIRRVLRAALRRGSLREINSGSVARYGGCVVSGRTRASEARGARRQWRESRATRRTAAAAILPPRRGHVPAMGTTPPPAGAGLSNKQHKSRRKISLPWFRQSSVSAPHAALSRQHTIDTPGSFHARLLKSNRQRQVNAPALMHPPTAPRAAPALALALYRAALRYSAPAAPRRPARLLYYPFRVYWPHTLSQCINKQNSGSCTLRCKIKRFKYWLSSKFPWRFPAPMRVSANECKQTSISLVQRIVSSFDKCLNIFKRTPHMSY